MNVRYAGTYSGPSYGNFADPSFEGFYSLAHATAKLRERVNGSGAWPCEVIDLSETADGVLFINRISGVLFPATTNEDYIDLYPVDARGYRASEPSIRLTVGPRGGIVRENF